MADSGNSHLHSSALLRRLSAWYALSRPPFHLVGLFPFVLGNAIAWRELATFRWDIAAFGAAGVVLVMLSAYYAGEYWDIGEDRISRREGATRFSGGSGVIAGGQLERVYAFRASVVALVLALCTACILFLLCGTGPLTVPLAILGITGGFLYSSRPVRWVSRGVGELWIALCYGWLPVATGFYLQAGGFIPDVHLLALPVACSIFSVILLNEFPDFPADRATGKRNLLVRLGHGRAVWLLVASIVLGWGTFFYAAVTLPILPALLFSVPSLALSLALVHRMLRGEWRDKREIERLCGANILVNLGMSASLVAGLLA